ncbi:MAG: peptidoglycan DD-metalloendopeptidase family protein [Clostridia bacterium]|nr:peptidoglycan DD-metalloendopeptidase family protein [Clostridia bacterium]
MKKSIVVVFCTLLILFCLSCYSYSENLRKEQQQIQTQIDASNIELELVKEDLSNLVYEISDLNDKIVSEEIEIENLKTQEASLTEKIKVTEEELEKATEKYNNQEEMLEARLVAMYEAGETHYLDILLTSRSITELISNYYMISEIVESDTELLETIRDKKEELEIGKLELEKAKKELSNARENAEKKAISLENMRVIKNSYINQLTNEEKEIQEKIAEYQSAIKRVEAEIVQAAELNIGIDYVGGEMAWPVPGYTRITSQYGMRTHPITGVYKLHTGVDISAPIGANFVAANDGVVVKAEFNSAYGNMVMINHGGGVSTLYAHGSEILVQVGQEVKRGDAVLKVGSTGYSTGPHAHFEVRVNGQYQNPMPFITKQEDTSGEENQ